MTRTDVVERRALPVQYRPRQSVHEARIASEETRTIDGFSIGARQARLSSPRPKPDRLSVVLVGNAAAFTDQLKGIGFGSFETVEIGESRSPRQWISSGWAEQARHGGDGRGRQRGRSTAACSPVLPPGQQPAASRTRRAKALLDRVIAATGGIETLRAIRNMTAEADCDE